MDEVNRCAVHPPDLVLHSYRDGTAVNRMRLEPLREKYGQPYLVIHRADIRRILYDRATSLEAHVRLGFKVDWSRTDVSKGLIISESGEELHADLIVAADGEHSKARETVTGRPNAPIPLGVAVNRVLINVDDMANAGLRNLLEPPHIHVWLGPESMIVTYQLKGVFNIALCRPLGDESLPKGPRVVTQEYIQDFCEDWELQLKTLLSIGQGFQEWALLGPAEKIDKYVHSSERLVLIGDAADYFPPYLYVSNIHSHLCDDIANYFGRAQGAAMGFESAAVLCHLLNKATSNFEIPNLLHMYNSIRKPRVDSVREATFRHGRYWMMPDGPEQVERDRRYMEEEIPLTEYPSVMEDPDFQPKLFGYDGKQEVDKVWSKYCIDAL